MHKAAFYLFWGALMLFLLAGCSQMTSNNASENPSPASSAGTVPVSLTMTDDPPSGVTILFFQISLTGASLTPQSGSAVSLLANNTPIQVDVTQLQALSAFLSTANVPSGTYKSLSLTFADPELVIYNMSDQSIASTCALNTVCQLTPTIDNPAALTFSSAPFPVTLSTNSPLGFLIDFHLNTIVQSDLSVNLGVTNGVTVAQLPSAAPSRPPQFGFLDGTVQSVDTSQNQFMLQTPFGRTFTVDVNSSTTYDGFPSSVCSSGSLSCLTAGQTVRVEVSSLESGGDLLAAQVSYLQAAGQQTADGAIVGLSTVTGGATVMKLILHGNPSNNSTLTLGGEASVTIGSGATFSVGANGFTIPSGLAFTGVSDLLVGQQVLVNVAAGSLTAGGAQQNSGGAWGPPRQLSFTTDSVVLEPSQMTGSVTAINSSAMSFTLASFASLFFPQPGAGSNLAQVNVQTTSQTMYQGFSTDDFSAVATKNIVSVNGWLFPSGSSTAPPTVAAQTIILRSNGMF
jgi:hypothetical protein